jgi:NAD+-dependent protein deacetylase sirtuin 2
MGKQEPRPAVPPPPPTTAVASEQQQEEQQPLEQLFQSRLQVKDDASTRQEEEGANVDDKDEQAQQQQQQQHQQQQQDGSGDEEADNADASDSTCSAATPSASSSSSSSSSYSSEEADAEAERALLQALGVLSSPSSAAAASSRLPPPLLARPRLLPSLDLQGVAAYLASPSCQRVVFLVGAGASTNAGIPDFRTPGSGLYDNLQRYNLPHPEAVFEIDFFRRNPYPFYTLVKSLYPASRRPPPGGGGGGGGGGGTKSGSGGGNDSGGDKTDAATTTVPPQAAGPRPTAAHHFFELVRRKQKLLAVFTQNIDSLEHEAGLGEEHVVAAHGNFHGAHCVECGKEHDREVVESAVFGFAEEEEGEAGQEQQQPQEPKQPRVPRCRDARCNGLVKPSIVFFGEGLPRKFFERRQRDLPQADLLVVVGTSLIVHPFAGLIHDVQSHVPRLLINRERVGEARRGRASASAPPARGFVFDGDAPGGGRDVLYEGDADEGVRELARLCGWAAELEAMVVGAGGGRGG